MKTYRLLIGAALAASIAIFASCEGKEDLKQPDVLKHQWCSTNDARIPVAGTLTPEAEYGTYIMDLGYDTEWYMSLKWRSNEYGSKKETTEVFLIPRSRFAYNYDRGSRTGTITLTDVTDSRALKTSFSIQFDAENDDLFTYNGITFHKAESPFNEIYAADRMTSGKYFRLLTEEEVSWDKFYTMGHFFKDGLYGYGFILKKAAIDFLNTKIETILAGKPSEKDIELCNRLKSYNLKEGDWVTGTAKAYYIQSITGISGDESFNIVNKDKEELLQSCWFYSGTMYTSALNVGAKMSETAKPKQIIEDDELTLTLFFMALL